MKNNGDSVNEREKCDIERGWLIPISRKRWKRVSRTLGKHFRNYCENSSLTGYGHLAEPNRPWLERIISIAVHAMTFWMLGLMVSSAYTEYRGTSVVTVIDSMNYPSINIEFPGISICNVNRISRKSAMKLASEIVSSNVTTWEFDVVLDLIRHFGSLYESGIERNVTAENYLHELLIQYYKGDYDVRSIMKRLTPTCSDAFLLCRFRGRDQNCSDLLQFRRTQNGYCCIFNDVREPDDILLNGTLTKEDLREPYHIDGIGQENGLTLVMEPFANDYHYSIFPIIGFKAREYPGNHNGATSEILLSRATMTLVQMRVLSSYSEDRLRDMDVSERECIFHDDVEGRQRAYTEGDCRVDCFADVIWKDCKCRSFFLPRRTDVSREKKICDLSHVECFRMNREKNPANLSNNIGDYKGTEEEYIARKKMSRDCKHCYPTCADVMYRSHVLTSKLEKGFYQTELLRNVNVENQSILHVYFASPGSLRNRQEVAYTWYEFISNVGGICGIFIGLSLVSIVEFFYHAFCVIFDLFGDEEEATRMKTPREIRRVVVESSSDERHVGRLYWNEFFFVSTVNINGKPTNAMANLGKEK